MNTNAENPAAEPAVAAPAAKAKKQFLVTIYRSWCKKCGVCIELCPKKVFDADSLKAPIISRQADCIGCIQCELQCPDLAIRIERVLPREEP